MTRVVIPSDDGEQVAAHPGHARYLLVATVREGQVAEIDVRENPVLALPHGPQRRQALTRELDGVAAFISRGMGRPLLEALQAAGIEVYATSERTVAAALEQYVAGTLEHHPERVHEHHDENHSPEHTRRG